MANPIIVKEIERIQKQMEKIAERLEKNLTEEERLNVVKTMQDLYYQKAKFKRILD